LTKGQQEQGTWNASMNVATNAIQQQSGSEMTFSIPLDEASREAMNVRYLNETEVLEPGVFPECIGNAQEPFATEGWLCVYQGATGTAGSLKTEWKNAKFFGIENAAGETCLPVAPAESGVLTCTGTKNLQIGGTVVFRTNTFKEPPVTIPAGATLNASGSWAVRPAK
jgi:hypothetical protein